MSKDEKITVKDEKITVTIKDLERWCVSTKEIELLKKSMIPSQLVPIRIGVRAGGSMTFEIHPKQEQRSREMYGPDKPYVLVDVEDHENPKLAYVWKIPDQTKVSDILIHIKWPKNQEWLLVWWYVYNPTYQWQTTDPNTCLNCGRYGKYNAHYVIKHLKNVSNLCCIQ
jgi:hypothetical protein